MIDLDRKKPFRVGLTGGIASGKSTVADYFSELGATVIDTDIIARSVVEPGQPALDEIRSRFGDEIIDAAGDLDRRALRKRIFFDDQARLDLEAILHPRIQAETMRQSEAAGNNYQIIVVPLLVESSLIGFADRVLVVDCDRQAQIRRLLERDAETPQQVEKILAAQSSREDRLAIADDVIRNDSDLDSLFAQVKNLDRIYRDLAGSTGPQKPASKIR